MESWTDINGWMLLWIDAVIDVQKDVLLESVIKDEYHDPYCHNLLLRSDIDGAQRFYGEPEDLCNGKEGGRGGCADGICGCGRCHHSTAGYILSVQGVQTAGQLYRSLQCRSVIQIIAV